MELLLCIDIAKPTIKVIQNFFSKRFVGTKYLMDLNRYKDKFVLLVLFRF